MFFMFLAKDQDVANYLFSTDAAISRVLACFWSRIRILETTCFPRTRRLEVFNLICTGVGFAVRQALLLERLYCTRVPKRALGDREF